MNPLSLTVQFSNYEELADFLKKQIAVPEPVVLKMQPKEQSKEQVKQQELPLKEAKLADFVPPAEESIKLKGWYHDIVPNEYGYIGDLDAKALLLVKGYRITSFGGLKSAVFNLRIKNHKHGKDRFYKVKDILRAAYTNSTCKNVLDARQGDFRCLTHKIKL